MDSFIDGPGSHGGYVVDPVAVGIGTPSGDAVLYDSALIAASGIPMDSSGEWDEIANLGPTTEEFIVLMKEFRALNCTEAEAESDD